MLTEHTKIKQLDVASKKSSSNNDLLLVEKPFHITLNQTTSTHHAIPQFIEFLIQGLHYCQNQSLSKLKLDGSEAGRLVAEEIPDQDHQLSAHPITELSIQPPMLIDWGRQFRDSQTLYRQTGATQSTGILLTNGEVFSIECIDFHSSFLKLMGALIKKAHAFYPIFFSSHRMSLNDLFFMDVLAPNIIICQSAITSPAVAKLIESKCTVYGFCRKNKFNRYSNFHL